MALKPQFNQFHGSITVTTHLGRSITTKLTEKPRKTDMKTPIQSILWIYNAEHTFQEVQKPQTRIKTKKNSWEIINHQ
jgi:hypothetical protein